MKSASSVLEKGNDGFIVPLQIQGENAKDLPMCPRFGQTIGKCHGLIVFAFAMKGLDMPCEQLADSPVAFDGRFKVGPGWKVLN